MHIKYIQLDSWGFLALGKGELPITPLGLRQALEGQIVSSPADRSAIAKILAMVGKSPTAQMEIRRLSEFHWKT